MGWHILWAIVSTDSRVSWPGGKAFAFSVFDDTDLTTLLNGPPVYDLLAECGLRTTKSVWPLSGDGEPRIGGSTCEDPEYLAWVHRLQEQGFEIALHNVTYETSPRERTRRGLDRFRDLFGHDPASHANHSICGENIYWGSSRCTGPYRLAYDVLNRFKTRNAFQGHVEGSPLFWGDLCRERVTYVRNLVHSDVNTLAFCPQMPYHDPRRPYVNYWFASTEGPDVDTFVAALSDERQDELEASGGACIMYTHFGSGFAPDGRVDPRFARAMRRLGERNGWFVPVRTLLDHLRQTNGHRVISDAERARLERRWLVHKLRVGGRS